jgi:ligand-binding SRPBCC domain-containing protein
MRAVAGVTGGPLHLGETVTWRARHFGVLWRMTSKIVTIDRPHCFVDHMENGPFAAWQHTHMFEESSLGTRMRDDVQYRPPLGVLGRLFDAVILERYLRRLLRSRNDRLRVVAENGRSSHQG